MQKLTALYCHRDWIMLTASELVGQFWDSFQCYSPSCAGLWINRKFQSNYPVQFVRWIDSTRNRKTSQFSFGSAWEDFYGQWAAQVCQKFTVNSRKLVTVLSTQIKINRLNKHCYYFLLDTYQRKAKDKNTLAHSSLKIASLLVPSSSIRID